MTELNGEQLPSHWKIYSRHLEDPATLPMFGIIGHAELSGFKSVIVYHNGNILAMSMDGYDKLSATVHGSQDVAGD